MLRKHAHLKPILAAISLAIFPVAAIAGLPTNTLPANGSVQSGQASASISGSTMNISLGSAHTVIDWGTAGGSINAVSGAGGFDVGSKASVVFGSSSSSSTDVLNIDTSGQPSEIDGTVMGSNVSVYLANANGVVLTSTATFSAPEVVIMANSPSTALNLFNTGDFSASGLATGAVSLESGAQINAGTVLIAGNGDVNIGNSIDAGNTIDVDGEANITGNLNAPTVNMNGGFFSTGTITANHLNVNLTGYVNDNSTGQILANGFTVNAGSSGTVNIALTAESSEPQGFNIFINGNGEITNGNTVVSNASPNKNSRLIAQASGTMTIDSGSSANPYGSQRAFQFPGLLYLEGLQGITVNADLVNAYSANAPVGYGVFVIGPTITDSHNVYANGSRGVNFEGPYENGAYQVAQSINGQNPNSAGFSFPISIFFASTNANGGLQLQAASSIKNPTTGYMQPNNLFLGALTPIVSSSSPSASTSTPVSTNIEEMVLQDAIGDTLDGNLTTASPQFQAAYPAVQDGLEVLGGYGILPTNQLYSLYVQMIVTAVVGGQESGNTGSALNNIAVATAQSVGTNYMEELE